MTWKMPRFAVATVWVSTILVLYSLVALVLSMSIR